MGGWGAISSLAPANYLDATLAGSSLALDLITTLMVD